MQSVENCVQVLVELGLTRLQAKVYIKLLSLGLATAKDIQRHVDVARQDIYRILSELKDQGLVEKIVVRPTKFKPIPMNETISILC